MIGFRSLPWIACALVGMAVASAQDPLAGKIRKEIATLNNYGVFDNVSFQLQDGNVTLAGSASRPQLKKQIEKVVKDVEGVQQVTNNIEVLPNSSEDDRIRTLA
jgi:hypothetical protein